jgi:hypothetical protein
LLNHVELHRYLLEQEQGKALASSAARALEIAAASWYDKVYLPMVEAVRKVEVLKHFPNRTETDLYIWLIRNQAALRQRHKLGDLDLPSAVRFWLAYIDKASSQNNLTEVDLPQAVEKFLESIGE